MPWLTVDMEDLKVDPVIIAVVGVHPKIEPVIVAVVGVHPMEVGGSAWFVQSRSHPVLRECGESRPVESSRKGLYLTAGCEQQPNTTDLSKRLTMYFPCCNCRINGVGSLPVRQHSLARQQQLPEMVAVVETKALSRS